MAFQKAVKHDAKLRMSIAGPSGSGKTYTALKLATALADGQPIALIDTERGSASKYADVFSFDVMELDNFHPDKFVVGIHEAQNAGYAVLIIDSLTHAWNGTGGLLDLVDAIARRKYSNNTFAAWKDATPIQNALIDAITASPLHIIVTMRSKQEYALEKDERTGKSSPKKIGMAPIQRDGMEYEFDIVVDMDIDNTMIVSKSRCSALSGAVIPKPDKKVMDIVKPWLSGVVKERPATTQGVPSSNDATKPDTQPATSQNKNGATKSVPSNKTPETQKDKIADDLANIPTVKDLRELATALEISWENTLAGAFKSGIEKGKLTLEKLLAGGDELPPNYCKIIEAFLNEYAAQPMDIAS